MASQESQIITHLNKGKSLTSLEALHLFGTMRLAARIEGLRGRGHKILTQMVEIPGGKRVAKYRLAK